MTTIAARELMGTGLASALEAKGYTSLTQVQEAVLDPALAGRDLRISSQTGSGKTVAIGLTIREAANGPSPGEDGKAKPRALVIAPTRELAKQVEDELTWLFEPLRAGVASVTGGASYRDERRAFARGPAILVGTPGRLLDHLERGGVDPSAIQTIVFDEADRMLDLGFRETLEAIIGYAPADHRTHLVSATFPREVKALADSVQNDPAHVEGTPLGTANADIEHVVHVVDSDDRLAAMINLLLAEEAGQTLVFARTRADVAEITQLLGDAGFRVASLSGEMEQRERNRALSAFKRGDLHALVATDVAARGIDVQDIVRVIHAEPPSDPESYTHRSGRTGRAGRKGTSSILVTPPALNRTRSLLTRARVRFRFQPIPTSESIRAAADERLFSAITTEGSELDVRTTALAERLAANGDVTTTIARLLAKVGSQAPAEPREVRRIDPSERPERAGRDRDRDRDGGRDRGPRAPREERAMRGEGGWVPFRVTWGKLHGADPRRLLAMVCRRGGIRGSDVGAIDIQRNFSVVDVASAAAGSFARAAGMRDPRDPRVLISPLSDAPPNVSRREPREFVRPEPEQAAPFVADRPSKPLFDKDRPSAPVVIEAERPSKARIERERPSKTLLEDHAAKPLFEKDRASKPIVERPPPPHVDRERAPKTRVVDIERPAYRDRQGPAKPRYEGTAKPRYEGTAKPRYEGTAKPRHEGPAKPRHEGPAKPRHDGPGKPHAPKHRAHGGPSRGPVGGQGPLKRRKKP
ncbi:ATP-dependent RNA helicase [Labilithrix luteola]|uniref:ATP-dependent RNA helicase n=1 Tax=Labilithrix luteola TaxID=1391654 RepID=A0A0K1Q5R6_9BACT|nr:DEAD/DEAH box helicase [Labilithrix luteola]AKV00725.1 ATP-dependent RNA helicase [Labilithrix luteola]